jgi:hypothetical protein
MLTYANFAGADLRNSILDGSYIYGTSVWDVQTEDASQNNLVIHNTDGISIITDNIEIAQFLNLLLHNAKIRHAIDTVTSKVVLLLGRFLDEHKAILTTLAEELRATNYIPVTFDFTAPDNRNLTEMVSTLAHIAKFIIVNITDARSVPQELYAIIPHQPSVPIQPLLHSSAEPYAMFADFRNYPWMLETVRVRDASHAKTLFRDQILAPVEGRIAELRHNRVLKRN